MAKKKISSKDFIDLLDDQEMAAEKPAFKPTQAKRTKVKTASSSATSSTHTHKAKTQTAAPKGFTLTPMQREWIELALSSTPGVVTKIVTSDRALNLLEMIYASLDEAIAALYRLRAQRAKA